MASWKTRWGGDPPPKTDEFGLEWSCVCLTVAALRGLERPRDMLPSPAAPPVVEDRTREDELLRHIEQHGKLHESDILYVLFLFNDEKATPYFADNGAVYRAALAKLPPNQPLLLRYTYVLPQNLLRTRAELEFGKNRCPELDYERFQFGHAVVRSFLHSKPNPSDWSGAAMALAESGVAFFASRLPGEPSTRAREAVSRYKQMAKDPKVAENCRRMLSLASALDRGRAGARVFTWAMLTHKPWWDAPPDDQALGLDAAEEALSRCERPH